jgi:predicted nucleic acid-binding protein
MLLSHTNLSIQDSEVVSAALGKFRSRLAIGFSDCLLLEVARKTGQLALGTFDRNLSKFDGTEKL